MFEEYVPSVAVALVTVMLVALVLLAMVLASIDRRGLVYDVVVAMGATSVITACIVTLCALFLAYGPLGRSLDRPGCNAVPASERVSTNDEGSTGAVPSRTNAEGVVALPPGLSE
jgi:hypothetical protein